MAIREVIFRGKRTDNGEWVYGYYTKARYFLNKKEMHIIFEPDVEAFPHCEFTGYEEVFSETVGQYTGLTDKNGMRIFEGDIVSLVKHDSLIYKVVYVPCRYELVNSKGVNCFVLDIYKSENIEVIGNIHDNPEILKGGGDNG